MGRRGTTMTGYFSVTTLRLLAAATILQASPNLVWGAVGSRPRPLEAVPATSATAQTSRSSAMSATAAAAQNGDANPGVHPPNSKPYGLSYGEWSARWW